MKKLLLISTAVLALTVAHGQTTTSNFYGTWFLVYTHPGSKDTLTFSRTSHTPHNWGQRIEINKDGEFVDADDEKCGNDSNIHHTVGKWTFNNQTNIFETTIPIYFKDKKYKITSLTSDTLIFVKP